MKCDFCLEEGDWINIIKTHEISKLNGSDVVVCDYCFNLYTNKEWKSLIDKLSSREVKR